MTIIISAILVFQACDDDLDLVTSKNTYYDDIADVTFVHDHFFTTNYDISGHSGPQIDLFKFQLDTPAAIDAYPLDLNGQGYFAITNDHLDLYLISRRTNLIYKYSTIGQRAYLSGDTLGTHWQSSGICYLPQSDSLFTLYRNLHQPTQYRGRRVAKNEPYKSDWDILVDWDFIDAGYHGAYALTYREPYFYILGVDQSGQDVLFTADHNLVVQSIAQVPDSTVVGLCFDEDQLYLSFRDHRILPWDPIFIDAP